MDFGSAHQEVANEYWNGRYAPDHRDEIDRDRNPAVNYTEHPFLYGIAVSQPLIGNSEGWWLADVAERHLKPAAGKALALGSGLARPEEFLVKHGYVEHLTVFEMSQHACDTVQHRLASTSFADRLEVRCGDVLDAELPAESFDLVFVEAAIHHFIQIDEMFALIHRVLKPGGLLIFDEYVGPDHMITSPDEMALLNRINDILPDSMKWDHVNGFLRTECPPPSLEWMLANDPTEGVHSSRILPLTYQYFDVQERLEFGGTLVRPFFSCILPCFDFKDEKDRAIASLIVLLERELTSRSVLPHHNIIIVGRKREIPRAPLDEKQTARICYSDWIAPQD